MYDEEAKGQMPATASKVDAAPEQFAELERLFREHHALVYRAAYRVTGSHADAEDVLQTVFLRLMRGWSPETVDSVESYLYRSAVNAALDVVRSRQSARTIPLGDAASRLAADNAASPDRAQAGAEIRQWLRETVARLSPQSAEVFVLRFFEGKDNHEIARILGSTPGSVAVTLHRLRERIEREFRKWEKSDGRTDS